MNKIDYRSLKYLLSEVFSNSVIPEDISDLKIGDIAEWDSLGNFNLLLLAEISYGVKFSMSDMASIKSVKSLMSSLEALKSRHASS
jgi:acyl carrier protein